MQVDLSDTGPCGVMHLRVGWVTATLLIVAVFSLMSDSLVASQSYVTQTSTVTATITSTRYSEETVTTYTNSTTMSTQLYSSIFTISSNQKLGGGWTQCSEESLPLDIQGGEKITGSVSADGYVYFGILTTDQYKIGQFLTGIPTSCQAYVSQSMYQNSGKSFQITWTAPSSSTYYFLFVNLSASKISLQLSVNNRIVISTSTKYQTREFFQSRTVNSTITATSVKTTSSNPGIPGFSIESQIAGLVIGMTIILLSRRIRRTTSIRRETSH